MKKTKINGYSFILKTNKELSEEDKQEIYKLNIKIYPKFKNYYEKNKYYSTIKPNMVWVIKDKEKVIGTGKFLWKNITVGGKKIKLFSFGILIDKDYQNKGLGSKLTKLQIEESRKRKADIVYVSTENPVAEKMAIKSGFKKLNVPIFFKEVLTNKKMREMNSTLIFEFRKGIIKEIEKLDSLYIGRGPI
ncbi:MAG: GNAT family N-acetyltransferase [Candidatus Nanoarchaeia archaeon]